MKSFFRKAGVVLLKFLGVVFFIALFAIVATSVSPVYNFSEARPFSGPDIFNPYASLEGVDSIPWKRANFHTHTRVKGILNEC